MDVVLALKGKPTREIGVTYKGVLRFFNRGEIIMEKMFFVNIALLLDLLLRL